MRKKDVEKIVFYHNKSLFQYRKSFRIEFKYRTWVNKIFLHLECVLKNFRNHHGGVNLVAKSMPALFCNNSTYIELPTILYDSK